MAVDVRSPAAASAPRRGAVGAEALEARVAASSPELAGRRRAAWARYLELPPPSSAHDEDWRRTDVARLHPEAYVADPGPTDHGEVLVDHLMSLGSRISGDAALLATTRNGVRRRENVDRLTAEGVVVCSIAEAARDHAALLAKVLDQVRPAPSLAAHGGARFLALWNALHIGGVFVYVPPGVEASVPVVAAHSAAGDHAAVFPATLAVVDHDSSLTLAEVHASPASSAPLLSDAVTSLVVGDGARLDHCVLQQWGEGATHIALSRATLGRDARYRNFVATLGAGLQKSWIEALLEGQGGEALIAGVVFGGGGQHHDHQSLQAHRAPSTRSDLLLKVAVRDRARSVYSGLIDVAEAAQKTDAYVQNRNLMLSRGARATGIPRLEIRADDVRCSHGVTAGHLDDDERFYLQTRGISPESAERLIVRGFMQDALDRCPHPGFADVVGGLLDAAAAGRHQAGVEAGLEADADAETPR